MKVWDCFSFFNELELLEIRLNELWNIVDYFGIIEANKTFQGDPKPYNLEEDRNILNKYGEKIIYLKYNWTYPKGVYAEHIQQNLLVNGFKNAQKEDLIIYSDIDEIPNSKIIEQLKIDFKEPQNKTRFVSLSGPMYCYKLNGLRINEELGSPKVWYGPILFTKEYFDNANTTLFELRKLKDKNDWEIKNSTWHFSYIGDTLNKILYKFQSWGHARDDFVLDFLGRNNSQENKMEKIQEAIDNGKYYTKGDLVVFVRIDDTFPKYLVENQEKFKNIIHF